ncbi:DnaJ family molecular chaperone [Bartonella sp. M0280]|uniref:J domain-containing protein n=1 Tax=Bartonella apihabitans TaxID=2750929 RepID=UPI0018DB4D9A|nr:DnaJ family molecular chaperone [Bartonella apihabitans]MBI0166678.1 DnaJ family molecular chaperone [Bartonella apihabitans]
MPSLWTRIGELINNVAGDVLNAIVERVRNFFEGDPETRRQVAFSVSMIALSAKMAKADGVVSDAEVKAFYEIFSVPDHEFHNVERLYNLAKQDIAGFDVYARRLFRLCQESDCQGQLLEDVLEGLFYIAKSDGVIHQDELVFLREVSDIFGFSREQFRVISARHAVIGDSDPWLVLGLKKGISFEEARKRYHDLVREHHPDRVMARGLPKEFLAIANERLAAINNAWAIVREELVTV